MKSLSTRQTELTGRRDAAFVQLVKLTTYTDRGAETVDAVYYFADRSLLYDYGNTGTDQDFAPFLMRSDPVTAGMEHLVSLSSGVDGSQLQKSVILTFRNGLLDDGTRLAVDLRTHNLEFSRVELAQLPVDLVAGEDGFDLRALTGAEHVVWFRGELEQIERVTPEEISARFVTELPQIPWYVHADSALNDPKDYGKRGNIVYGLAQRIPGLTIKGGARTTITVRVTIASVSIFGTDVSSFSTSGTGKMGSEEFTWTGKTGSTTLTGVTRGTSGTVAKRHAAGEVVTEVSETIIEWAHHECHSINGVYVKSPFNGELVHINIGQVGRTDSTADTTSITGETITSTKYSVAQMKQLFDLLATQAAEGVGQQPNVSHTVPLTIANESPSGGDIELRNGIEQDGRNDIGFGTNNAVLTFPSHAGSFNSQKIWVYNKTNPISTEGLLRIRVTPTEIATIPTVSNGGIEGWYSFVTTVQGNQVELTCDQNLWHSAGEVKRDYNLDSSAPSVGSTIIDGDSGFGFQFFADIQGYKVPAADTNFKVAAGTLIQHPTDIRRHIIAILCGLGHGAVDSTTFDATETNLGGNVHYARLNELGNDFANVNASLDAETRSQLVQEEAASGSVYKLHAALSTYAWPAKTSTITLWQSFEEEGRDAQTLFTRFRALYDVDRSIGIGEEGARGVLRVDVDQNDISSTVATSELTTAEQKFGRHDHPGMLWLTHREAVTAEEVLGYHVTELKRIGPIYSIRGVPWVEGYAIERGDIVGVTPPWETAERKCRVLEYVKNWDSEMIDLRTVEVA